MPTLDQRTARVEAEIQHTKETIDWLASHEWKADGDEGATLGENLGYVIEQQANMLRTYEMLLSDLRGADANRT